MLAAENGLVVTARVADFVRFPVDAVERRDAYLVNEAAAAVIVWADRDPDVRRVLALARSMYGAGDFSAMPILADALQDAGCDSEERLAGMRDEGVRWYRGSRVVDSMVGWE